MKKQSQREKVIELLKKNWYSGFAMNMAIKSTGGAPRITELKTTDKLEGWKIEERRSLTAKCQEYRLVPDEYLYGNSVENIDEVQTSEGQKSLFKNIAEIFWG